MDKMEFLLKLVGYLGVGYIVTLLVYMVQCFLNPKTKELDGENLFLGITFWPAIIFAAIVKMCTFNVAKFIHNQSKKYHERQHLKTIVNPNIVKKFKA